MNAHLKCCPDLRACELEDRLLPVTPNLGTIVQTTRWRLRPSVESLPRHRRRPLRRVGRPRLPHAVRHYGLGGSLRSVAGDERRRPRPRPDGAGQIEWRRRRDDPRRLGGQRRRRREYPAGHAQHNRQRRPQCRVFLIGRPCGNRSAVLPPEQVYRGGLPVTASGGLRRERPGGLGGWARASRLRDRSIRCRFGSGEDRTASPPVPRGISSDRTRIGRPDFPGMPSLWGRYSDPRDWDSVKGE